MVCSRCKMVVKSELEKLGLHSYAVELGEVKIHEEDIDLVKDDLVKNLHLLGFGLMDSKKSITIERIKTLIIELVHDKNNELKINLSYYLSEQLSQDYNTLSYLFSEVEGITIEKYFIAQKVEKVKELLMYDELTLSEITYKLNYSSVAHLSNQFKKITGFPPTYFKQLKDRKRRQIEDL